MGNFRLSCGSSGTKAFIAMMELNKFGSTDLLQIVIKTCWDISLKKKKKTHKEGEEEPINNWH